MSGESGGAAHDPSHDADAADDDLLLHTSGKLLVLFSVFVSNLTIQSDYRSKGGSAEDLFVRELERAARFTGTTFDLYQTYGGGW